MGEKKDDDDGSDAGGIPPLKSEKVTKADGSGRADAGGGSLTHGSGKKEPTPQDRPRK